MAPMPSRTRVAGSEMYSPTCSTRQCGKRVQLWSPPGYSEKHGPHLENAHQKPAALELSLAAAGQIQEERERLHHHWKHRLERARYETDRAARQYHAVEPEIRQKL